MKHITAKMLAEAISAQADVFLTHDIIRFLYTNYQHDYLEELTAHANARLPFTETHRQVGQALGRLGRLVRRAGKEESVKTLRGRATLVQKWQRVPAGMP